MYDKDINPVCALCQCSQTVVGSRDHLRCEKKNEYVPLSHTCADFKYDIFKKPVHRRRRKEPGFTADDFTL